MCITPHTNTHTLNSNENRKNWKNNSLGNGSVIKAAEQKSLNNVCYQRKRLDSKNIRIATQCSPKFYIFKKIKRRKQSEHASVYFLFYILVLSTIKVTAFFLQNYGKNTVLAVKL